MTEKRCSRASNQHSCAGQCIEPLDAFLVELKTFGHDKDVQRLDQTGPKPDTGERDRDNNQITLAADIYWYPKEFLL
ncbi:hypothetical protein [Paenibacillus periandrae]|uniref:hypothetical protein n=1 Tax=Paenibacillus periandrae TaxID=1761741 RepID=UPI001F093DC2|nr:hypothetical protein [Paenibacillus periandrae]